MEWPVENKAFDDGVRQFAGRVHAKEEKINDVTFIVVFPDERRDACITIDALGMVVSYAYSLKRKIHSDKEAVELLTKNWNGVALSCFYVSLDEGQLYLETTQLVRPDATGDDIQTLLETCWLQYGQTRDFSSE